MKNLTVIHTIYLFICLYVTFLNYASHPETPKIEAQNIQDKQLAFAKGVEKLTNYLKLEEEKENHKQKIDDQRVFDHLLENCPEEINRLIFLLGKLNDTVKIN